MLRLIIILVILAAFLCSCSMMSADLETTASSDAHEISWRDWSAEIFAEAQQQNRLVILHLGAVWCHWCHVMEEKTYRDTEVIELLTKHYIPVYADQDARPDLSDRYQRYGWPATIVFNAQGEEIVKRRGYIPPAEMIALLTELKDDPKPREEKRETQYAQQGFLTKEQQQQVYAKYTATYDHEYGSWGKRNKFLDWDSVEYAMVLAASGDELGTKMARQTLDAQLALIDPVWGGVYQYSTGGKWDEPHFEKIMSTQAYNVYIYCWAYAMWNEPRYLQAAKDIHRYLRNFLQSPQGAFYTSQDADLVQGEHSEDYFSLGDNERRARGIPRIDTNIYSRENGWAILALVSLYCVTGERQYLDEATKAAQWIIANRSLPEGGFRHDKEDSGGPFLGDTLAMGRAFICLYTATGEREWLTKAKAAGKFTARFQNELPEGKGAGFMSTPLAQDAVGVFRRPTLHLDQNVKVARFYNMLYHYTSDEAFRELATHAMKYLASPQVIERERVWVGGILLANWELANPPAHIVVVGSKKDAAAADLFRGCLRLPSGYKWVEWYDEAEGPLPRKQDYPYPNLGRAAAFICLESSCSSPIFDAQQIPEVIRSFSFSKSPW